MANRTFDRSLFTIQKRVAMLWAIVGVPSGTTPVLQRWGYGTFGTGAGYTVAPTTGGGTGFPTRYAQGAEGAFGVARTATGLWTITLQDQYKRILDMTVNMAIAGGLSNIIAVGENTTITNLQATGGSVIGVTLLSSTATAADPTAGASTLVKLTFTLQDATEP